MRLLSSVAVVMLFAGSASAQAEPNEVGRRLKAFELAWEKYDAPAARKRALAELEKISDHFAPAQLGETARALDRAAFALQSDVAPGVSRQWAWSLYVVPEARVVDGSTKELAVTIKPLYAVKGDMPKGLELQLWFTDKQIVTVKPEKFPVTVKVPLPPLGEFTGLDRKLYFLADAGKDLRPTAIGISQIADLQKRLDRFPEQGDQKFETIEQATAAHRAEMVGQSRAGTKRATIPLTDLPYADLLANAETMLDGKPFFTVAKHGQFWMSVPDGRTSIACRVYIPKGLDAKKPVPVVVALQGEWVDENMFFENHGAGQIVKECEKRGWVLVAPQLGPASGRESSKIIVALAKRYPLDRKCVFVVAHSIGAGHALDTTVFGGYTAFSQFAAIAVLGGGTKVADTRPFAKLPVFIGVGDKDALALPGARALNKSLSDGGAKAVTYKEYPDLEHLMIVREALPDVFAMFDQVAGK